MVMADETTQAVEQQSHEQAGEEAAQPPGTSLRARNFTPDTGWYGGLAGDEPAGGFYARVFSEAREDAEVELINRAAAVLGQRSRPVDEHQGSLAQRTNTAVAHGDRARP